jgi:hypothetical protein
MWNTERKCQTGANAAADKIAPENLDVYVDRQRKKMKIQKDTTVLRNEREALEKKLTGMTKRYQLRKQWDTEKKITDLTEAIELRESGKEQADFEDTVQLYMNKAHELETTGSVHSGGGSRSRTRGLKRPPKTAPKMPPLKVAKNCADRAERRTYDQDSIRDELMAQLDDAPPPIYIVQGDVCEQCNVTMVILGSEAVLGCPQCSRTRVYIQSTSSRIAYGEEVEFASFSYKRQNHFQEWLNTFQAKESTEVSSDIITKVMHELYHKKNLQDVTKITQKKVKEVLKELRLRRYYDHTPQITARITGVLPPRMTPFQEEQCKLMFAAIQAPFALHCPANRTNFR